MKKKYITYLLILFFPLLYYSQDVAYVTWKLVPPDSNKVSIIVGNLTATNAIGSKFVIRDHNGGTAGPLGLNQRWWPGSGVSWGNETTQTADRYIQFSIAPKVNNQFIVSNVAIYLGGGGTSGMKANIAYSLNADFSSPVQLNSSGVLTLLNGSDSPFSFDISQTVASNQTFYVRIYPIYTGAVATTGKYLYVQNLVITGTTKINGTNEQLSLTTTSISEVTSNSAKSGGNIISDGGEAVTARGVCWNISGNPTVSDSKTIDGSGSGSFTSLISGLNSSTKYFLRAYATNSKGTAYGNEVSFTTLAPPMLAFPTAEGYGRYTIGGRGGKVYEVTNLNDDNNPGSLRYAINQTGPRTIVFRVSGTIFLKSGLSIKNGYLTIAGQTAPGDGICIAGFTPSIEADNIIVRYIRFRLGDINVVENDAFNGRNHKDIIIDHCSMSWSVDEVASFYDNQNFTMQWCIIGESLYNSAHDKGAHGYGGIQGGWGATFHHNLYIHNTSRNPRFCGARYHTSTYTIEIVDFVNNVIYNWGFNSIYGGELGQQNVRANYFKAGPATKSSVANRILNPSISSDPVAGYGKFYVADNYVYGYPGTTTDNWATGVQGVNDQVKAQVKVTAPFQIADVKTHSAEQAFLAVLNIAGANFPKRDAVDSRMIEETRTGTATYEGKTYKQGNTVPDPTKITGIIDSQTDVGGWPDLKSTTPPIDSDHDGMPDTWETSHGLKPNDDTDGSKTSSTGYTNLEDYLNEMVASSVTEIKNEKEIPSRFSLAQNYPNPFNPETVISFQLAVPSHVTLKVFDVLGREVITLVDEFKQAGYYSSTFSTLHSTLSSGLYFYTLRADNFSQTKKMILIK